MTYIDVHGHLAPLGERGGGPPSLRDPERSIAAKRESGVELTIIGTPVGPGSMLPTAAGDNYRQPVDKVRAHNEAMGLLVERYPASLRAYAYLNPLGDGPMLSQAVELLKEWQFVGFIVNTSIDGRYLDDERAEDFFAMVSQVQAPVLLHPPAAPVGAASMSGVGLVEHVARVCDVTSGVAAIVCAGWLERYPHLRLIAAAGGGALAFLPEKLDMAMAPRPGAPKPDTGPRTLTAPPSESLRRLLVETSCPSAAQLRANLETFGSRNILFGTDAPPLMDEVKRIVGLVEELDVSREARADIAAGNAARLFGLDLGSPRQDS
jgi:predicted TIM-barrel fold metal-dependent hydrolase